MPIVRRHMSAHALHSTVPVWEYVHSSLWSIIDRCLYCCWTVLLVVHPPYEQSTSGGLHCVCLCSGSFSCSWPVVEVHGEYRWSSYWWNLTGITFMFRDVRCLDGAAAAAAVLLLNELYGIKERLLWAHRIELTCRTPWVSPGGCGSSLISAPVCVCKGFFNPWKPAETSHRCCFFLTPAALLSDEIAAQVQSISRTFVQLPACSTSRGVTTQRALVCLAATEKSHWHGWIDLIQTGARRCSCIHRPWLH